MYVRCSAGTLGGTISISRIWLRGEGVAHDLELEAPRALRRDPEGVEAVGNGGYPPPQPTRRFKGAS